MAWEARSGLKPLIAQSKRSTCSGLNGLGSPFGIETMILLLFHCVNIGLNGLGSPFGIETSSHPVFVRGALPAKWPGKPVRD